MNWKEFATSHLSFTRKERLGIIVIVVIFLGIFFLPDALSHNNTKQVTTDTAWIAGMKRLEQKETENDNQYQKQYADDNNTSYQYDRSANSYSNKPKGELFYFDPNTLSTEGWQKLGLRDKTIHTIQNYLSKGGHFRKPEDLQRIYGLFPNEFERIVSYIKIESGNETISYRDFRDKPAIEAPPAKTYTPRYSIIDVNLADTAALIVLPGIGSKLALRIINFRDKLGGFYSTNQIGETFGLPDSTFQKIKQYLKADNKAVRKININKATVDELTIHPYIKYSLANPIVAYRNEHGSFARIEDLKKIMAITDEIYNKITPYLIVE